MSKMQQESNLRSAAAPRLLVRSVRPVGARTDPAGTLRARGDSGRERPTAAFPSSAQAPAASAELQSEPRRGRRESRRLRRVQHHLVPALVRAARRKCHQRPFRSAPHFRPEPQSPRGRLERPLRRESPGAGAGSRRRARQRHLAGGSARSSRCGEPGTQAADSRDFFFFPAFPSTRLGSSVPEIFLGVSKSQPVQTMGNTLRKGQRHLSRALLRYSPLSEAVLGEARGVRKLE